MTALRITLGISACIAMTAITGLGHAQTARVVPYEIVNARSIPTSLTGGPGNAELGRRLFFDRDMTGCSGCHGSPGGPAAQLNRDTANAPSLKGVARRLGEGTLRLWLVAPGLLNANTAMPAYYEIGQRDDPLDPRFGEPRLSAAEIEALIAYLLLQKD